MATDPKYLRDFSCFREFSDEQLDVIAEITDAVCYMPGHIIFKENDPGAKIYILEKGSVEVLYNISEEGPVLVDTVSGQEVVGCSALIEPYQYTATERCLTEVEVLEIDAQALRDLMEVDCHLGYAIQKHIINVLMERITNLRLEVPA